MNLHSYKSSSERKLLCISLFYVTKGKHFFNLGHIDPEHNTRLNDTKTQFWPKLYYVPENPAFCPATHTHIYIYNYIIQWGKQVFSQPPIVQVLPLKKMREACNFHHRYTSTMRDKIRIRKSHCRIFKEFICK